MTQLAAGCCMRLQDTIAAAAADADQLSSLSQLASVVYQSGSAGAALLQRCFVQLHSCSFDSNRAQQDAGALLVHQPVELFLANSSFHNNTAALGAGGALTVTGSSSLRPAAAVSKIISTAQTVNATTPAVFKAAAPAAVAVSLQDCSFTSNAAPAGIGGAAVFDSQLGSLTVSCRSCKFAENSGGGDGGGAAVSGQTVFDCVNCSANDNTAGRSGGWLYCSGCSSMTLTGGSSSSNSASAAGGAVACQGCGAFAETQGSYSSNTAASGGAVAVQSAAEVTLESCGFDSNSAASSLAAAAAATAVNGGAADVPASLPQLHLAGAMPFSWQMLYGVGSAAAAAASTDCSAAGSGGAVCISSTAAARLDSCEWHNNTANTGGAVFASAVCDSSASSSSSSSSSSSVCQISMSVSEATGNSAEEAGGFLYTSTPEAIQLYSSSSSSSGGVASGGSEVPVGMLQQLAQDNSVSPGGYGPGAASFPALLSLVRPEQPNQQPNQQQQQRRRQRRHLLEQSQPPLLHQQQELEGMLQWDRTGRRLLEQQQQQQQQASLARLVEVPREGSSRSATTKTFGEEPPAAKDTSAVAAGERDRGSRYVCSILYLFSTDVFI
jgi:hypothetical protein